MDRRSEKKIKKSDYRSFTQKNACKQNVKKDYISYSHADLKRGMEGCMGRNGAAATKRIFVWIGAP
jgi:hypothetical protein